MDLTFQIKGKAIVRDADYIGTPQEAEEAIENVLMDFLGVNADIHVSDIYEVKL
jgi:hypothetical protein